MGDMKSTTLFTVRHNGATVFRTLQRSHHAAIRYSSTEVDPPSETSSLETDSPLEQPSLQTTLHAELTSRPINTSTDYISFNAHRIHLDPQYTREVEGHRHLLVHGPLTLVLMLSVLRSQITEAKMVSAVR